MVLAGVCAPYVFTLANSVAKSMCGNKPNPTWRIVALVLCVETAHSFGLSLFVFRVLAKLDVARAILIMNAVCTLPGLFKLLLGKQKRTGATATAPCKRLAIFVLDAAAVLMQASVFGIVFASKYLDSTATTTATTAAGAGANTQGDSVDALAIDDDEPVAEMSGDDDGGGGGGEDRLRRQILPFVLNQTYAFFANNASAERKRSIAEPSFERVFDLSGGGARTTWSLDELAASFHMEWELPIALVLVSLAWWENFVDRDVKCGSRKLVDMKLLKENLVATRCKTNVLSSAWKIAATLLFAYAFHPGIVNVTHVFDMPHAAYTANHHLHPYQQHQHQQHNQQQQPPLPPPAPPPNMLLLPDGALRVKRDLTGVS